MKINIEIDCTPDEARRFMGLPEVAPMQQRVIDAMESRLVDAIAKTETNQLVETWLPLGMKGIEQWQQLWTQLAAAASGMPRPERPKKS
jgi:hypothetical protein